MENTRVIRGTEELARGELDNVTLDEGGVVLDQADGDYLAYGCYTTPALRLPAFDRLLVSWNADTPPGTVVEVQARVLQSGKWSSWRGFGRWSPWMNRWGVWQQPGEGIFVRGGTMVLPEGAPGSCAQLRAYLYTEDDKQTPTLRLLAASVRPTKPDGRENRPLNRELRIPAYSMHDRGVGLPGSIAGPTALASLMNRWGQDILPEELAHLSRDCDCDSPSGYNLAFLGAAAGSLGFSAWQAWLDMNGLRDALRGEHGVLAAVRPGLLYTPPEPEPEPAGPDAPAGENAAEAEPAPAPQPPSPTDEEIAAMPASHRVVVRGMTTDQRGQVWVMLNDPAAPDDEAARIQVPVERFLQAWEGRCLIVDHKFRHGGKHGPQRMGCQLVPAEGREEPAEDGSTLWQMVQGGKPCPMPAERHSLMYTRPEELPRATTAHKRFYHDAALEDGLIRLPAQVTEKGSRVTLYCVDGNGCMRVADHVF